MITYRLTMHPKDSSYFCVVQVIPVVPAEALLPPEVLGDHPKLIK